MDRIKSEASVEADSRTPSSPVCAFPLPRSISSEGTTDGAKPEVSQSSRKR